MPNFWKKINKPILALAPMAGYTNSPFRQICKAYEADVVYSEMANATALSFSGKKTLELLEFNKTEKFFVVQLFGNDPKYFKKAAQIVSAKIKPDGIDINMGCPVKKVFFNGGGAALMLDSKRAREIIKQTLDGTSLPVSIKIRSKVGSVTAYKFVKKIKDLPISAIMVHGRSMKQGFFGEINYSQIKKVRSLYNKKSAPIILANGGIDTPEDAGKILKKTAADGIGIARGALKKPWLFFQTKQYLETGEYKEFSLEDTKKAALEHARMSYQNKGKHGVLEMRKYLLWYFRGFEGAKDVRKDLVKVKNIKDIKEILKKIKPRK